MNENGWTGLRVFAVIIIAFCAGALAQGFTTSIQRRPDGVWLVISNAPARWTASWSQDLTNWQEWASWRAQDPMQSAELRLGTNRMQFWRVTEP